MTNQNNQQFSSGALPVEEQPAERKRALLEKYLSGEMGQGRIEQTPIVPRPGQGPVPVSFGQQQVWLHAQMQSDIPFYNESMTVYRDGPLDCAVLERCLIEIVRRHEIWRTTFEVVGDEPVQVAHPAPDTFPLRRSDLSALPEAEREREALRLATADLRKPFDLKTGPLLRALLVTTDEKSHCLYLTFHHLVFDAVTAYWVFLPELEALYEAFSAGKSSPLDALRLQYADFAHWQRASVAPGVWSDDIAYWRKQLKDEPPPCSWPKDRPRPLVETHRGALEKFALPAELGQRIRTLSQEAGVTVYMTLLAGLAALLRRYTDQDEFVIGSLTWGRNRAELEKVAGYFVNSLPLRIDVSGDPTFRELQTRVRRVVLDGLAHENVPFLRLVEEVQPRHDPGRNPLFQIIFSQQPELHHAASGWNLRTDEISNGGSQSDLLIVVDDRGDEISGPIIYNSDLFESTTVRRMVGHWGTLLEKACEDPSTRVDEFSVLTPAERNEILVEWNETAAVPAQIPVHELFEEQAARIPHNTAVQCGSRQLTYGELNERANQLACSLRALGVGPEVPVALHLERSVEMIVGILGILKAGGGYVPLDPSYPQERLAFMLADCKPAVLVTQSSLALASLSSGVPTILLDGEQSSTKSRNSKAGSKTKMEHLAYIIYTSGSTGGPKGVQVTHGNLAHSNQARLHYYADPVGRYLLLSSYAFDSSIAGIFHSLTSGGILVVLPPQFRWEPRELASVIEQNQITHMLSFPSVHRELLEHAAPSQLTGLRTVIVAGEPCPRQLVNSHYRLLPEVSLFNEYGPTEATVWASVYECEPGESEGTASIGRPIPGAALYVLDAHGQPAPAGVPGELYIGGAGIARGYLNRPELTQASFVANPFHPNMAGRLYRTGDIVRYLSSGDLEFLGRQDQQVKIRGLRIELPEIETTLSEHPDVCEAVAVTKANEAGDPQLLAFVAVREKRATSSDELRFFLKSRLPDYMVPATFYFLNEFPRIPNGKVDRQKLMLLESEPDDSVRQQIMLPRNDIENRLLTIWQRVLKTDSQDITQNFFAAGGHSLLAAKLLAGIEKEFGKALSLAFVFQAPTIEQMADSLRTAGQSLRDRAIVPIQPKGIRPPLFFIRGGPRFRLIAQELGPEQPLLGLDLPFTDGAKLPVPYRMEDIAALLVQALREAQPRGPYYLAGLCVNGVLAYEIARQLLQDGDEVGLLAMFDGHNNDYYKNPFKDKRYSSRMKYHLSNLLQMEVKEAPGYLLDRLDEARRKIERITWQLVSERSGERLRNTDSIVHPAFQRYEPKPYPGKMVLLQSSDWPSGPYFDFKLGWNDLVSGGIEFHLIPGDHPSMFTEPNVRRVAQTLRTHLDQQVPAVR
jgi:surfactin family lipopeptide synthetase A